jgi:hypothetical protein
MEEGVTALIGVNETVMLSGVEPFDLSAFLGQWSLCQETGGAQRRQYDVPSAPMYQVQIGLCKHETNSAVLTSSYPSFSCHNMCSPERLILDERESPLTLPIEGLELVALFGQLLGTHACQLGTQEWVRRLSGAAMLTRHRRSHGHQ